MYEEHEMPDRVDNFPRLERLTDWESKRQYVEDIMTKQALNGEISVVEYFNDQNAGEVINLVGQVLEGLTIEGHAMMSGVPVPFELEEYRVKVRSITFLGPNGMGETVEKRIPIKYKNGFKADGYIVRGRQKTKIYKHKERWIDPTGKQDCHEAILPLRMAFQVLKQYGKECTIAVGQGTKQALWRYEEVPGDFTSWQGEREAAQAPPEGLLPQDDLLRVLMVRLEEAEKATAVANEKIAELMAAKPAKRKRGRPKKAKPAVATEAVEPPAPEPMAPPEA